MRLYQLSHEFQAAVADLESMDIPPEALADTVEGLQFPVEQKGRDVAAYILNLEAEWAAVRAVEERIAKRRKTLEGRIDWLKRYLKENMEACGISDIAAADGSFRASLRKSPPRVIVDDEAALPLWATEVVRTLKIHKESIRQAIARGEDVPGAHLEQGTALVLR